ncbi:unnamed protein product [Kuraishia capsulata CBS 1993]|uniref:Sialidase domain-containing protein n=1 Tax=Kuraishia capsulata CBS 1993 TaxID=1382522 RepID=W6MJC2_9ASCO|nr:uncharacterized protein KUCA_T00002029001 [Kuraishia capsulata CBS 1993]CDK26058.1 unnamed protein product [Kuraishia capsulata CBS 1993]
MKSIVATLTCLLLLMRSVHALPHKGNGKGGHFGSGNHPGDSHKGGHPSKRDYATVSNVTIFTPDSDFTLPGVYYARSLELADGTVLATWENYSPEPPLVSFPIFKSTDGGATWTHISNVTDQVNSWGLRYQPFLYLLEEQVGEYAPGTILLAGNSIPTDLNYTKIDVYASKDNGYTWEFVSNVASGGRAVPDNGLTPIWEPFIITYNGEIVLYYSDQGDSAHGQILVHKTSTDLLSWSSSVVDAEYYDYYARPGMTTVAKLPNGKYIMTYEYGGAPGYSSYTFAVYYHIADDPRQFNSSASVPLVATNGDKPSSSPYVIWTEHGGENGTIVVNSQSHSGIYINKALGDPDSWEYVDLDAPRAYTRDLNVIGGDKLVVLGAGAGSSVLNHVTYYTYWLKDLF